MKKNVELETSVYSLPDPEKLSKDPSVVVVVAISLLFIGSVLTIEIQREDILYAPNIFAGACTHTHYKHKLNKTKICQKCSKS